jgi:hypothetical protein
MSHLTTLSATAPSTIPVMSTVDKRNMSLEHWRIVCIRTTTGCRHYPFGYHRTQRWNFKTKNRLYNQKKILKFNGLIKERSISRKLESSLTQLWVLQITQNFGNEDSNCIQKLRIRSWLRNIFGVHLQVCGVQQELIAKLYCYKHTY